MNAVYILHIQMYLHVYENNMSSLFWNITEFAVISILMMWPHEKLYPGVH